MEQIFPHIIHSIPTVRPHFNILWNTLIFSSASWAPALKLISLRNENIAMFSFLSEINLRAGAQPSTIQKLFRALVRPILLYNCEVWGAFLKSKSNTSFEKLQAILFDDKLHHELLHNRLCKHLLRGIQFCCER